MSTSSRKVIVIGGGIVGSSTAFYLKKRGVDVTLLEASYVAAGSSGKAGGFLASDWHGAPTASLSLLSYRLHKELSREFGDAVGYRELTTASIAFDLTSPRRKKLPGADWVNPEAVSKSSKLGGTDTTAQVHPRLLTEQLAKAVNNTVIAQAEEIQYGEAGEPVAVLARTTEGKDVKLECTDVVIATGPWTGRFMRRLFGKDSLIDASDYNITGSRAHSIVLRSSQPLSAHALFTSIQTGKKTSEPELYARPDGTGYLCGPTDNEPLPERADQVKVDPKAIATLKAEAVIISPEALGEKAVVEAEQACYLPISSSTGSPILAKLKKGIYLASGHSCWGILQGPATGMAMSELILDGKVSCCDVSLLTA